MYRFSLKRCKRKGLKTAPKINSALKFLRVPLLFPRAKNEINNSFRKTGFNWPTIAEHESREHSM